MLVRILLFLSPYYKLLIVFALLKIYVIGGRIMTYEKVLVSIKFETYGTSLKSLLWPYQFMIDSDFPSALLLSLQTFHIKRNKHTHTYIEKHH